jgi:hypothetical protein
MSPPHRIFSTILVEKCLVAGTYFTQQAASQNLPHRMHGRADRMHGRADRMHGRADRMHGRAVGRAYDQPGRAYDQPR